jgi:small redox-active disulfide protein 2
MIVKVLGTGCTKCTVLYERLLDLKTKHQLDIEIEKVTELNEIMNHGIMMTPGLVINDKVKSSGKIPAENEILKWIKES